LGKKKIKIKNKEIEYELKRRKGMRCLRLSIFSDGTAVVTAPKWYPAYVINKFLQEKSDWLFEKLKNVDFQQLAVKKNEEKAEYAAGKECARAVIASRVEFFNRHYQFAYNRISIKNQKSCWGSCSQKKNLNFSYKVASLPEELRDYVIVHELCHLRELNHSSRFWRLVAETIVDYNERRRMLRMHIK
jgi:predicted metal-dependent hydrolase